MAPTLVLYDLVYVFVGWDVLSEQGPGLFVPDLIVVECVSYLGESFAMEVGSLGFHHGQKSPLDNFPGQLRSTVLTGENIHGVGGKSHRVVGVWVVDREDSMQVFKTAFYVDTDFMETVYKYLLGDGVPDFGEDAFGLFELSQQEEVATATHQIELDPVQIALNSAAETI